MSAPIETVPAAAVEEPKVEVATAATTEVAAPVSRLLIDSTRSFLIPTIVDH